MAAQLRISAPAGGFACQRRLRCATRRACCPGSLIRTLKLIAHAQALIPDAHTSYYMQLLCF